MIAITDSSGNVVQTYQYDAFGKIVQQTGSVENSHTYTGREWDAEAGLYYYRARYYDPTLGRFINGDPIGFAGGDVNFYVYVQNNPVNFVDPDGRFLQSIIAGGVGGGIVGGITFAREYFGNGKCKSFSEAAKSAFVSGVTAGVSIGVASTGIGFAESGFAGTLANIGMQKLVYGDVNHASALASGFATSMGGAALSIVKNEAKGLLFGFMSGSLAAPVSLGVNESFSNDSNKVM